MVRPVETAGGKASGEVNDLIVEIWNEWDNGEATVERVSERVMGELLPLWACAGESVAKENCERVHNILSKGPQDEFTGEAANLLNLYHQGDMAQEELAARLQRLTLEQVIFNSFWTANILRVHMICIFGQFVDTVDAGNDLTHDTPMLIMGVLEYPPRKAYTTAMLLALGKLTGDLWHMRLGREPRTPANAPHIWRNVFEKGADLNPYGAPNLPNGILKCYNNGVFATNKAMLVKFRGYADGALKRQIEKSPAELCAVALILLHDEEKEDLQTGGVLGISAYFTPETGNNYPKAIELLNEGQDITLEDAIGRVEQRYPLASAEFRRQYDTALANADDAANLAATALAPASGKANAVAAVGEEGEIIDEIYDTLPVRSEGTPEATADWIASLPAKRLSPRALAQLSPYAFEPTIGDETPVVSHAAMTKLREVCSEGFIKLLRREYRKIPGGSNFDPAALIEAAANVAVAGTQVTVPTAITGTGASL